MAPSSRTLQEAVERRARQPGGEAAAGVASQARLKGGAISPFGLTALAIGLTSPALGLYALWGSMQATAGPISPLIFIAAMLVTLPTAISYAVLNGHAPSAGAASTWVWIAVGPAAGYQSGLLMTTYFVMSVIASPLLFALFFNDLLHLLHIPLSGVQGLYVGVMAATIPTTISCLRGAKSSTRATVVLMVIETAVMLALSMTILFVKARAPHGLNLAPFDIGNATSGLPGFWSAIMLGMLAYCGFDVVSSAAEETRAPAKYLPRVILFTILVITIFWAFNAWVLTLSTPDDQVREYARLGLPAVTLVAQNYWGWGGVAVDLTALTGVTAVYISGVQGSSRIIFALARHGLLPGVLAGLTGDARVPRKAIASVLACTLLCDFATIAVLKNGVDSFNWWANAMVFFAVLTFIAVNVANGALFLRRAAPQFGAVKSLLIPAVGVVLNCLLLYEAFFSALWSMDMRKGKSIVVSCLVLLACEAAGVLWMCRSAPGLFRGGAPIGSDGAVPEPGRRK